MLPGMDKADTSATTDRSDGTDADAVSAKSVAADSTAATPALTTAEAAARAGVAPRTIRRWIAQGVLPAITGPGGRHRVFAADLDAALEAANVAVPAGAAVADEPVVSVTSDRAVIAPDPASDAAGAVLVAWRDTVLAPVVAELADVRRELGDARELIGGLRTERDELRRRVAELEAERRDDASISRSDAPGTAEGADATAGPFVAGPPAWRRAPAAQLPPARRRPWWRRLLGLP